MTGRLYGVGVGPGDPELVTVKAARLIGAADVIAYHSARHGRSIARRIAAPHLRGDQIEEALVYPVTTELTDHPGGYRGAIDEFYAEAAQRLASHSASSSAGSVPGSTVSTSSRSTSGRPTAAAAPLTLVTPGTTSVGYRWASRLCMCM